MKPIVLWHNTFPPSINRLYIDRGGQKVLTQDGRAWKNRFKESRGGLTTAQLMGLDLPEDGDFILWAYYYRPFNEIFNPGHPSLGGSDGRTKYRHKGWDQDGLIKITQDATAELLGFNDRASLTTVISKRPTLPGKQPGVLVIVEALDLMYDPFELGADALARIPSAS